MCSGPTVVALKLDVGWGDTMNFFINGKLATSGRPYFKWFQFELSQ